jgi:hypothetical protein
MCVSNMHTLVDMYKPNRCTEKNITLHKTVFELEDGGGGGVCEDSFSFHSCTTVLVVLEQLLYKLLQLSFN